MTDQVEFLQGDEYAPISSCPDCGADLRGRLELPFGARVSIAFLYQGDEGIAAIRIDNVLEQLDDYLTDIECVKRCGWEHEDTIWESA